MGDGYHVYHVFTFFFITFFYHNFVFLLMRFFIDFFLLMMGDGYHNFVQGVAGL